MSSPSLAFPGECGAPGCSGGHSPRPGRGWLVRQSASALALSKSGASPKPASWQSECCGFPYQTPQWWKCRPRCGYLNPRVHERRRSAPFIRRGSGRGAQRLTRVNKGSSFSALYFTVIALPWRSTVLPTANRTQPSLTQSFFDIVAIHAITEEHAHAPLQQLRIVEGAGRIRWRAGRSQRLVWRCLWASPPSFSSVIEVSFAERPRFLGCNAPTSQVPF